ncbi:siderophore-interacting protein [Paraburkholderia sp. USG1]|uniref:siderophore-interacting protein n=1 Tax=Paraburkholderia sp. USG1 TaxID=2952268 RepID=UPI00285E77E3|nr:siderophore-interacting protein [Paraburkholderia sp. USG1]MDR8398348.1 siderophore-interacting protein [Paraburkholderia sp. USG1]
MLEAAVLKLFTRRAHVVALEDLNPGFRILTLGGEALRSSEWTPGDRIQIQLGGWTQRTYTPLDWDRGQGTTRILVHLYGDGPGAHWAREAYAGAGCVLFGPRRSINLRKLAGPTLLFGDETSLGLAAAFNAAMADSEPVRMLFEASVMDESGPVIKRLGLRNASTIARQQNDAHLLAVDDQILAWMDAHPATQCVLTGKSTSIQQIRQLLRQHGVAAARIQTKAYWAPGKTGLD